LALFGRRPSVPGDSFVIPASENLHKSRLVHRNNQPYHPVTWSARL
jgi:hypothetical protein